MLELNKCQLIETRVANLLSTVIAVTEGTPLVHAMENGVAAVKPSTGAAGEKLVGIAIDRPGIPTIVPRVETRTVPASSPYTLTLEKPVNGNVGINIVNANGTRTAVTAGTPASNAGQYSISGNVVTFNSAQAGATVELTYFYAISMQEAMVRFKFDAFTPTNAPLPTVGLLTTGLAFTDRFDPASNWAGWAPGTDIKLGDGVFTLTGSGAVIDAVVEAIPGADSPFLGIRIKP